MNTGRITQLADGKWRQEQDYVKALELFRRLMSEYQKGETRYYDQAKNQIDSITRPAVGVSVSNVFLPDSEIQFYLSWRNVKRVELALYRVDLTRTCASPTRTTAAGNWIQRIDTSRRERDQSLAKETGRQGRLQARATRQSGSTANWRRALTCSKRKPARTTARDLILVTDASLVLKTSGQAGAGLFLQRDDGAPIAEATV